MPKKTNDKSFATFGLLWALHPAGKASNRETLWLCLCECRNKPIVALRHLRVDGQRSCGCLVGRNIAHGHCVGRPSRTYHSWQAMKERCNKTDHHNYQYYGGRGISVCPRWETSFENFLADMGVRPPNRTLDRIDNDGNYEPRNCKWSTAVEQNNNRRDFVAK